MTVSNSSKKMRTNEAVFRKVNSDVPVKPSVSAAALKVRREVAGDARHRRRAVAELFADTGFCAFAP